MPRVRSRRTCADDQSLAAMKVSMVRTNSVALGWPAAWMVWSAWSVSKGRCHDDLRWDHVGLYKDAGGTLAALLIDLGLVKTVEKGQEDKARREMLKKLGL